MSWSWQERLRSLRIDPEFQNLIPSLSSEEKLQLEANLKKFGCLDPLIVWQGENILLDGHNRYEICIREQIPCKIVEIELADRETAISWIANHQLGRRNITPEVASYLRGKRYLSVKGDAPKERSSTNAQIISSRTLRTEKVSYRWRVIWKKIHRTEKVSYR